MDAITQRKLELLVDLHKELLTHQQRRLEEIESYRDVFLKRHDRHSGKVYYSHKRKGSKKYEYLGTEQSSIVQAVKEAKYLEESVTYLRENIHLLELLLNGYKRVDYASINAALPLAYRNAAVRTDTRLLMRAEQWKQEKEHFKSQFPPNHPERNRMGTFSGIKVKSKSEVIISNTLYQYNLVNVYELPFISGDYGPPMYPDFTVLSPVDYLTEIIIEHIGRLDLNDYRDDFSRKLYRFMKAGYMPGSNLILTFDDLEGNLDSMPILKLVEELCKAA